VDKLTYLQRVPIFGMLEPSVLPALADMTHPQHYRRGQTIFFRGDPGNAMYVLVAGSVELTLPSELGTEVLVARLRPPEHFGELAMLDGGPRYLTAVAGDKTQVLAIYRNNLMVFLGKHADASLRITVSLCLRLRQITELLADMAFLDLPSRLAKRLCETAGTLHATSADPVDVWISQEQLAEMAGATREAVNRQLARLREIGMIETGRGRVRILRPAGLRKVAQCDVTELTLQT
jgi:CRP/FNR family transcriptional regulator, cyclic AMP receptor protein